MKDLEEIICLYPKHPKPNNLTIDKSLGTGKIELCSITEFHHWGMMKPHKLKILRNGGFDFNIPKLNPGSLRKTYKQNFGN